MSVQRIGACTSSPDWAGPVCPWEYRSRRSSRHATTATWKRCWNAPTRPVAFVLDTPGCVRHGCASRLFCPWLALHTAQRAIHVMRLVRQMHTGRDCAVDVRPRMRGQGPYAEVLRRRFEGACRWDGYGCLHDPERGGTGYMLPHQPSSRGEWFKRVQRAAGSVGIGQERMRTLHQATPAAPAQPQQDHGVHQPRTHDGQDHKVFVAPGMRSQGGQRHQ